MESDFGDKKVLGEIFTKYSVDVVVHFAAHASVPLSMADPAGFYQNNIINGIHLLDVMTEHGCRKMIFSSSAATFGEPQYAPIDEKHPQNPINPYGETKLAFEKILYWYHKAYGLQVNSFRYFNASGASERLGEAHRHESHLIPLAIQAATGKREKLEVYGNDYDTKDGTCVRDYIHVDDLAEAHILALNRLRDGAAGFALNLGNGEGYSVKEVADRVRKVSGKDYTVEIGPPRPGDPPSLVADSKLAEEILGWRQEHPSLEEIVRTAYRWLQKHPKGY